MMTTYIDSMTLYVNVITAGDKLDQEFAKIKPDRDDAMVSPYMPWFDFGVLQTDGLRLAKDIYWDAVGALDHYERSAGDVLPAIANRDNSGVRFVTSMCLNIRIIQTGAELDDITDETNFVKDELSHCNDEDEAVLIEEYRDLMVVKSDVQMAYWNAVDNLYHYLGGGTS